MALGRNRKALQRVSHELELLRQDATYSATVAAMQRDGVRFTAVLGLVGVFLAALVAAGPAYIELLGGNDPPPPTYSCLDERAKAGELVDNNDGAWRALGPGDPVQQQCDINEWVEELRGKP